VQALYDEDLADGGYVWNGSRLWAHQPDTLDRLFELMSLAFTPSGLSFRQRGILVTAAASALGDSYCSLAWGGKLGKASDAALAAGVLNGSDPGLTDQEKAMAAWARKVARTRTRRRLPTSRRSATAGSMTGRCSPLPPSWPFA
jgi:alkylhydroperoxidase family enzyme